MQHFVQHFSCVFTPEIVVCNIAEVEQDCTPAILHAMLHTTISGVDIMQFTCSHSSNIAHNVAMCVQALMHVRLLHLYNLILYMYIFNTKWVKNVSVFKI